MSMIFVIAAALSITCLSLVMRYSTTKTEILWGVILGNYLTAACVSVRDCLFGLGVVLFNVAANRFFLLELTTLPGAIVFPVSSAGSLLLLSISAILLFKEKVSRGNLVGILLTLSAVVLINL
jgi:multidrug transporter EmrE-like cation transporter